MQAKCLGAGWGRVVFVGRGEFNYWDKVYPEKHCRMAIALCDDALTGYGFRVYGAP